MSTNCKVFKLEVTHNPSLINESLHINVDVDDYIKLRSIVEMKEIVKLDDRLPISHTNSESKSN